MSACSLCKGSQMVARSDGLMIKCPACFDRPSPQFNELYKYFEKAFIKTMNNNDDIIERSKKVLTEKELEAIERKANELALERLRNKNEPITDENIEKNKDQIVTSYLSGYLGKLEQERSLKASHVDTTEVEKKHEEVNKDFVNKIKEARKKKV